MADTVSTITLLDTPKRLVIKLLNLSDGTGESGVTKVDKSTYTGLNGLEPDHFIIERIEYDISGMIVTLLTDATSDVVLARMGGTGGGHLDYREAGGLSTKRGDNSPGDILLTTTAASASDSYDITLYLKKVDSSSSV